MGSLVATIVLLIFRQVTGSGTGSVMLDGVSYAAGFFFAYLIGREADPEPGREFGALLGALITLGLEAYFGVDINGVVALLWMLFICRMFNRTSGSRHRIGDNAIIIGALKKAISAVCTWPVSPLPFARLQAATRKSRCCQPPICI